MTTEPDEVKLAKALLQIACIAMPGSYYNSDSRCQLAREVLKRHGIIDYDPLEELGT